MIIGQIGDQTTLGYSSWIYLKIRLDGERVKIVNIWLLRESWCYRHDVNEEAGHLVKGVEDERVLPGQDGHSDGSVAQHEV